MAQAKQPGQQYTIETILPPSRRATANSKTLMLEPDFATQPLAIAKSKQLSDSLDLGIFLYVLQIRRIVFGDEQKCFMGNEVDEEDSSSFHWLLYAKPSPAEEGEVPAGTVRLVKASPHTYHNTTSGGDEGERPLAKKNGQPDAPSMLSSTIWDEKELYVKIGRLATLKEFRRRGYAKILVDKAIGYARMHPEDMTANGPAADGTHVWKGLVCAHAQKDVVAMYERLGFTVDEGMGHWWEEGIEHVGVWKRVEVGIGDRAR